jgi:histidine ammonia-lyase
MATTMTLRLSPETGLAAISGSSAHSGFRRRFPSSSLERLGLQAIKLGPKEGVALLNGTQLSLALALDALFHAHRVFLAAIAAGAMSLEAARASKDLLHPAIHALRPFAGQQQVAASFLDLLVGSKIKSANPSGIIVQDPYSLRCQPQVMGACFDQIQFVASQLLIEINSVTDNPLVFVAEEAIISGGNFHAQPIAFAADNLALAIAEIGCLSERRTALLLDASISKLPPFLAAKDGLDSGFMVAQYTAAALVSENKTLAHPSSVDSIPTSANQEDHVSMAPFAARKAKKMAVNAVNVIAIELLVASQGVEVLQPLVTSELLLKAITEIRQVVPKYTQDRYLAPDIAAIQASLHPPSSYTPPSRFAGGGFD